MRIKNMAKTNSRQNQIDEILESLWKMKEEEEHTKEVLFRFPQVKEAEGLLYEMEKENLLAIDGENVSLTPEGEDIAREIVRRHRLAERLFYELFELADKSIETTACSFEHILDPSVTENVCTFLGHPRTCPHGKRIPPGECCRRFETEVKPLTLPLTKLRVGEVGQVVFIASKSRGRLERLAGLGIVPGAMVKVQQTDPLPVVHVGEAELALDREVAKRIFVRRGLPPPQRKHPLRRGWGLRQRLRRGFRRR